MQNSHVQEVKRLRLHGSEWAEAGTEETQAHVIATEALTLNPHAQLSNQCNAFHIHQC